MSAPQPSFTTQLTPSLGTDGDWLPVLNSAGGGAPLYGVQMGIWTIIETRLWFESIIALTSLGTLAAGMIFVTGLPFPINQSLAANQSYVSDGMCSGNNLAATATTTLLCTVTAANPPSINMARFTAGVRAQLTVADLTATSVLKLSGNFRL